MSAISDDIKRAAFIAVQEWGDSPDVELWEIAARGIIAERIRCAEIARSGSYHGGFQTKGDQRRAEEIASRIMACPMGIVIKGGSK